jgi:peptidyl-tRNA hydrolase
MSILNWSDYDSLPHYLRDEEQPYSLPIIVRVEKDENLMPTHEDALVATAKAIALFLDDERTVNGGEWAEATNTWLKGRIRKVARRARSTAWDKAVALGGILVQHGTAEILVLPPHPVDAPLPEVKKLQVSGLDLPHVGFTPATSGLLLSLNPEIPMTTGKSLAQIGHATQLAIFNSNKLDLEAWKMKNFPIALCNWEAYSDWTADVQDAGFTEVPAGSLTAKSILL